MKKLYILLFVAISIANAAEEKFSVQANPLWPLFIMACNMDIDIMPVEESERTNDPFCFIADIQFQYAINKKFALFISPSIEKNFGGHTIITSNKTTYYRGNGLDLITGLLYHPYETGLEGMYLGAFPVIGWGYMTKDGEIIKDFLNIGYMAEIGYGRIYENGFTLTFGIGICKIYQIPSSTSVFAPEIGRVIEYEKLYGFNLWGLPFDLRLRYSMGYSF